MSGGRKKSKSKQTWRHASYWSETDEQRRARQHATKAAAKRRARKLRHARPNETPELRAARAQAAKAAAVRLFRKWLETSRVTDFASKPGYYDLVYWVKQALPEILPTQ